MMRTPRREEPPMEGRTSSSPRRRHLKESLTPLLLLTLLGVVCSPLVQGLEEPTPYEPPSIRNLLNAPTVVREGGDALLTCIVRNIGRHTVFWSRLQEGKRVILTVDEVLLSRDTRYSVLHDGGDVWVLAIKGVTPADTGAYVCQVNSNPPVQTLFRLTVESNSSKAAEVELRSHHNYTRCCQTAGVAPKCLGYCSIHTLLEGSVGAKEEECEEHLGEVVRCMADGRNHVPCCQREGVPDICQELCRGQYTAQDDYVKSHFSCADFLQSTLMCISEGVDLLPRPPLTPVVQVSGPRSLNVSWTHPLLATSAPERYVVTITPIHTFDPPEDYTSSRANLSAASDGLEGITIKRYVTRVPVNITHFVQKLLTPLTWYEVEVTSENRHGSSLPPYTLRALTRPEYEEEQRPPKTVRLPDVKSCCVRKGVTHERCISNLCNPHNDRIDEPDMIVCAPWAQEAFSCLADDYDHSACCRERGLPDVCVELCTGQVTKIDYKYFRCVDYFSDYRGCLLKGYGVLPSPPLRVRVSNILSMSVLISWSPPMNNSGSVTSFHSYYRPIEPERTCSEKWIQDVGDISYQGVFSPRSPHVLENLCPDTEYEIYIQAFNSHGTSDPSNRVLFKTLSETVLEDRKEEFTYNVTACCQDVLVSPGCMPLCDYNARMSHVRALTGTCVAELSRVLRCQVGGRNHAPCCHRRGVPDTCMSLCTGTYIPDEVALDKCNAYIGNIVLCLEDGVHLIPAPVTSLHLTSVSREEVTMVWESPTEGANVTMFQVHYQSVDKNSGTLGQLQLNQTMNTTDTVAVLTELDDQLLYAFFVVALNENGASLPSSVLHLNISAYLEDVARGTRDPGHPVAAVPSAPHSLRLDGKTATSLTILWEPPELALPTDRFRYVIHYSTVKSPNSTKVGISSSASSAKNSTNGTTYNITQTSSTALKLEALRPNTQYVIFVTATNDMGESRASETLLAWTDPAYPAFVETPTVHPTSLVVEGASVTVLCIAMGSPPPTVSLYIAGILVHQDVTRHMVTTVHNITRNMTDISCYADNGYGTPMQSSVTITISRPPEITAPSVVHTNLGRRVTLRCNVDAWPRPSVVWWRDPDGRVPVIHGGNFRLDVLSDDNKEKGLFTMEVEIRSVNESDAGDFYCFARNAFGKSLHIIKLVVTPPVQLPPEVSACCRASNMTDACLDACDFDEITAEKILNRDTCIPEFDKLVHCAADGSDHRSCCSQRGVPVACLDWCRQEPVADNRVCLLQWAPAIFACFDEGRNVLPGPPSDVRVSSLSDSSAFVQWNSPEKNPEKVELYRVFWRVLGQRVALKNDTAGTTLEITGLRPGVTYEVAVKAGNHKGTSVLTPTITYRHGVSYVSSARSQDGASVGVAVGIALAVLALLLGLAVGGWWGWRRRSLLLGKMANSGSQTGISFENPSYIKEQNGDTVQIAETPNGSLNGTIASELNKSSLNGGSLGGGGGSIGLNGSTSTNGGVWNTQHDGQIGPNTPGFEEDIKNNRKYARFNS